MDIEDKIVLALREKLPKSCEKYRRFQELGHTGIWREFDNGTITLKEIEWYANALHTLKQYDDETRAKIAVRYIEGIQHLLGKRFEPDMRSREERVVTGLQTIVQELVA